MGETKDPKKLLLPYLQRADELQKHEPLVAYYCHTPDLYSILEDEEVRGGQFSDRLKLFLCKFMNIGRLYAMERGLKIPAKERGKTVNALLVSLMNQLEKDKKVVKLSPDDNMYLEGFASRVFAKADKQDRAGRADLNTAKTFYAASLFFEVLHQFGEIPPDIEQRQKYAVWKAADIRKALSEGRKPIAGPPGGDEDFLEVEGMTWDTEGSPQKPAVSTSVSGTSPEASHPEEEVSTSGVVGSQLPRSNSLPRVDPMDSVSRPSTYTPAAQGFHHVRHTSSEDIDLPSAPTQPVHPGMQHGSPQYQSNFPAAYSPTHYSVTGSVQDTGSPPPPIRDWSGGQSHQPDGSGGHSHQPDGSGGHSHQPDRPGGPPYSSLFTYPTSSHDDYSSNPPNYSSFNSGAVQSPYVHSTQQGFSYSQYPMTNAPGHQADTYHAPSPSQHFSTGYEELPHHQRTASAPVAPQTTTVSNGAYPSDMNYQPPPDKVAEAHKAARFAVSSLAFDDVPTALEFLRKSLELLTVPSRAN